MSRRLIRLSSRHPLRLRNTAFALCLAAMLTAPLASADEKPPRGLTMQQVLDQSKASEWRALDAQNTLYMELPNGRVVIELAVAFAPLHAENIRTLVSQKYFDGLAILRVQDNFVTQWGDPEAGNKEKARSLGEAKRVLAPEFTRPSKDLRFLGLGDSDTYSPIVGFSNGFPAVVDDKREEAWLAHCYGMVGAGRDNDPQSGSGAELYVVIGHAPRQLDRNIATVGRVVQGMELLSSLPRGTGALGFYEKAEQRVPIHSIRLAKDTPPNERSELEVMRTDTSSFLKLIESRRNRKDDWYLEPAGHVDLCNVPIPVRKRAITP